MKQCIRAVLCLPGCRQQGACQLSTSRAWLSICPAARCPPLPHPSRRLYAFTDAAGKTKPGMVAVTDGSGTAVHMEIWEMPIENFGRFMLLVRGGGCMAAWAGGRWGAAGGAGRVMRRRNAGAAPSKLLLHHWLAANPPCSLCCTCHPTRPAFLQVPPPLGIGTVKLEGGGTVNGFICEGWVAGAARDSHNGSLGGLLGGRVCVPWACPPRCAPTCRGLC